MSGRAWMPVLVVGSLLAVTIATVPRGWPWALAFVVAAWLAPIATLVAIALRRVTDVRPFALIGGGFLMTAIATMTWLPAAAGLEDPPVHPGAADALFIVGCALLALGCIDLATVRGAVRRAGDVVDTMIVTLGAAVAAYPWAIAPILDGDGARSPLAIAVALAYPGLDLVLVGTALWIGFTGIRPTVAAGLAGLFLGAQLVADASYGNQVLQPDATGTSSVFALWALAAAAAAAAVVHPSIRWLTVATGSGGEIGQRRLVPLVLAALVGPVVTLLSAVTGAANDVGIAALSVTILVLASIRVFILTIDLGAYRRVLDELEIAQQRFRELVEQVPATTWSARIVGSDHPRTAHVFVSPQVLDLTGYPDHAFRTGQVEWADTVHPGDRRRQEQELEAALGRAIRREPGSDTFSSEYRILRRGGAERWVRDDGRITRSADGTPVAVHGVVVDITERHRLEAELRELNEALESRIVERTAEITAAREDAVRANRAKSEFLSAMSHDLRTPLNAILGFGQLLQLSSLEAQDRDSVEEIIQAGHRLLGMIDGVLELSRIDTGRITLSLEPIDLGSVIRDVIDVSRPGADERRIVIEDSVSAGQQLAVLADRRRLEQILLNLLSNAVKFSHPGGRVSLSATVDGDVVRTRVVDRGIGIEADRLGRLFEPFDPRARGDSRAPMGLGLPLSSRLAELMGGGLTVESVAGDGATFVLSLPRAKQAPATDPGEPDGTPAGAEPTGTILYIEDNLANLHLVERAVSHRLGVRMLAAMQGRLGLELAREHRPDLILLDLHLPDVEPTETLLALRADERTRSIPVVILSSDGAPGSERELRALGADAYLVKPFDIARFLAVVDRLMEGS